MPSRDETIEALRQVLAAWTSARAAWLGGSDASGRTDQWSDIDLQVIVEDDEVEEAFARVEQSLSCLCPIAVSLRLPQPSWHGHEQAFYQLRDADPSHMIDVVVMKRNTTADRFLERERHGEPTILFDHDGLIVVTPLDRGALRERIVRKVVDLKARYFLFQPLIEKAIAREHVAEAVHFYHAMSLRPVIDLLRIRHCPDRFDFGPRYLGRDLPANMRTTVDRLCLPKNLEELRANLAECGAIFRTTLTEIEKSPE